MSWQDKRSMTPAQYDYALRQLGLSKAAAGRYLGRSARTSYRYSDGEAEVPVAEALLLRALVHYGVRPEVPPWSEDQN